MRGLRPTFLTHGRLQKNARVRRTINRAKPAAEVKADSVCFLCVDFV